jgi:hypothetical protein
MAVEVFLLWAFRAPYFDRLNTTQCPQQKKHGGKSEGEPQIEKRNAGQIIKYWEN